MLTLRYVGVENMHYIYSHIQPASFSMTTWTARLCQYMQDQFGTPQNKKYKVYMKYV